MTLIRFDEVYVVYFKTNKRFIHQYPNLSNYTRDLYQTPGGLWQLCRQKLMSLAAVEWKGKGAWLAGWVLRGCWAGMDRVTPFKLCYRIDGCAGHSSDHVKL